MESFKKYRNSLYANDFIRHNLIFFVGTIGIAVFNYIYYPIVSRLVSVADFGEIQATISLFMQFGIILTAFGYVVTNIVANAKKHDEAQNLVRRLEHITLLASIALLILLGCFSSYVKEELKLHSVTPILLVGILVILNVPSSSRAYFLQGQKRLKEVSISGIIFAITKLLLTIGFIFITGDVLAALLAYIIAQLISLIYVSIKVKGGYISVAESFFWQRPVKSMDIEERKLITAEVRFGLIVAVILFGLALLYISDSVIARLYFDQHSLGVYSGISSIARIIFFTTASISGVLIASVAIRNGTKQNAHILRKSFFLLISLGGAMTVVFAVFPRFIIDLFIGGQYIQGAYLLPLLSLIMLVSSVNNLLATYQISLRNHKSVYSIIVGVLSMGVGVVFFHQTLWDFALVYLFSNVLTLVLLFIQIILERGRSNE